MGLFLLALVVRVICLPVKAYFCDVPLNQMAVETGKMLIQFPGYVPYHLLIQFIATMTGSVFGSLMLISLTCGVLSMLLCVSVAGDRAGFHGALLVSIVMGFSLIPVFFSCVGASYATDMLAAAGMVYHGNRFIKRKRFPDYYLVLGWFIFGCLMRPLSFVCAGMVIVYLLFKQFSVVRAVLTSFLLLGGVCLFMVMSIPFFGSFHSLISAGQTVSTQLQAFSKIQILTNLFRVAIYPLWGLHIFLVMAVVILWRSRKELDFEFGLFLLLLGGPYFCLLVRYIPHAGYYCLIFPVLISLPWVAKNTKIINSHPIVISLTLTVIFLCQIFVVRPVHTLGPVSLVSNVCMFQYSYMGIKTGMFETLSSMSYKSGVLREKILENRVKDVTSKNQ